MRSENSAISGQFKPGQSGNPGGRPKGLAAAVRKQCGEDGQKLITLLHNIAFGKVKRATVRDRLTAIEILADRGWGKAPQELSLTGENGGPLHVVFGGRHRPS